MPITTIEFVSVSPLDIHLVRGQQGQSSEELSKNLFVTPTVGDSQRYSDYLASHNDVSILFTPTFKPQSTTATEFRGYGIRVSKKTGRITVAGGAAPSPAPATFIIEATVTKNTGGVAPETIAMAFRRVHVHQRVERIWMTPEKMSVRIAPGSTGFSGYAFTVRAEFDDGTVADVSDSDELTFTPPGNFSGRFIKIPASATPGSDIRVDVKTSARWNSKTAKAWIRLRPTWDAEPDIPVAELVEGQPKVWDGTLKPEAVPNVLIVGCGFKRKASANDPDHDEDGFRGLTEQFVHLLKTKTVFDPYRYLATSMNYWRLMIPADTRGISVRCEVAPAIVDGQLFALPVPIPQPPPAQISDWSVEHLLYAVGLPVPADLALAKDPDTNQPFPSLDAARERVADGIDYTNLFNRWTAIARPIPGQSFNSVTPQTAHQWLALADRTYIDEIDGFPWTAVGEPPSVGEVQDQALLRFHYSRLELDETKAFLRRVKGTIKERTIPLNLDGPEPANALGNLWISDPAARNFAFDNQRLIVWLSNIPWGRADATIHLRLTEYFHGTLETALIPGIPVARVSGRSALLLTVPPPTVAISDNETAHILAHELGHAFGLGDEYDERGGTFSGPETDLDVDANLTTPGTFQNADGTVRVADIKWNWHRIRKASVLTRDIDPQQNDIFHVYVGPSRGFQFTPRDLNTQRPGDKVRLRKRTPRAAIKKLGPGDTTPVEFEVLEVHRTNINHPDDHRNMTVVLKADGAVNLNGFGAGSLMYIPVPAPDDIRTAARPYLTLVPPAAERIMEKIGGTLNGAVCDLQKAARATVPIEKDPAGKASDLVLPGLVGVYFSGKQRACGIAHPAGQCMMKNSAYAPKTGSPEGMTALCAVCRYAIVDLVDPEVHWQNDRDYDKWFPF